MDSGEEAYPPDSSDEERDADEERMQYAVLSSTRALVEKSDEVLQAIAADRESTQGDLQSVKDTLQSMQATQKKISQLLEKAATTTASGSSQGKKVNREVSVRI